MVRSKNPSLHVGVDIVNIGLFDDVFETSRGTIDGQVERRSVLVGAAVKSSRLCLIIPYEQRILRNEVEDEMCFDSETVLLLT